jgi:hypothetical protein
LHEGAFRYPFHTVEGVEIVGQSIIVHDAPILLLILRHNTEGGIVQQFGAVDRFAVMPIEGAFLLQHVRWHAQADLAVKTAVTAPVELSVVLQHHEVIAEEPRGLCPRMGDQGLGLGEFELEVLAQEPSDRLLDRLSLTAWAAKPQQPILRVPDIPQASIGWVVRVQAGHRLHLATQAASRLELSRYP